MRPSLALTIGALFNILVGLPSTLAPAQALSAFGVVMPVDAGVPARANGVLLIGVGLIDWSARGVVGPPLRWLLWVNNVVRGIQTLIRRLGAAMLPPTGFAFLVAAAGGDIALIAVFALALRHA